MQSKPVGIAWRHRFRKILEKQKIVYLIATIRQFVVNLPDSNIFRRKMFDIHYFAVEREMCAARCAPAKCCHSNRPSLNHSRLHDCVRIDRLK